MDSTWQTFDKVTLEFTTTEVMLGVVVEVRAVLVVVILAVVVVPKSKIFNLIKKITER